MAAESVREVMRKIRATRGAGGRAMTQKQVAARTGLSVSTVSSLEATGTNRRRVTEDILQKLEAGLGLSDTEVDDLGIAQALDDARPEQLARETYREVRELRAAVEQLEAALRERLDQKTTMEYLVRRLAEKTDT